MVALFLALLFFGLLLPFLAIIFAASGLLLFVKPQGLRPPWWDWGLDKPDSTKVEKPAETPAMGLVAPRLAVPVAVPVAVPETAPPVEAKIAPQKTRW